jgi:hypothetical protein
LDDTFLLAVESIRQAIYVDRRGFEYWGHEASWLPIEDSCVPAFPVLDPAAGLSVSAREASLRAAELRAAAAKLERRRAALDLLGRWNAATRRLALATGSAARADEHVLRMRSLYTGGGISLLELLDAQRVTGAIQDGKCGARIAFDNVKGVAIANMSVLASGQNERRLLKSP